MRKSSIDEVLRAHGFESREEALELGRRVRRHSEEDLSLAMTPPAAAVVEATAAAAALTSASSVKVAFTFAPGLYFH